MTTMRYIANLVLLVGFVVNCTTANVIPASILLCINKFARDCPRKHKDFYCLCGKRLSILKCLADSSVYGNFLEARDHFLGTCIEHIPDLSKHPDFNLELPDEVEYTSFPFSSSTLLLSSITSPETTVNFDSQTFFAKSTTTNSTKYPGQFSLNSTTPFNYYNSTMSILPIEEPIRNEQPDPTLLPFLPPIGPLTPPFYDIDKDCEYECKCDDELDLECSENKNIEHCIYKCISKKYYDVYDEEGNGDDVDGNDDDCDDDYDTDYEYGKCEPDDQKDCLYDDENTIIEYFKYKQAFLSLTKIDQQNGNINEESTKFWNEEKKARNDVVKEFLQSGHPFQQARSDLKNKNYKNENATGNKEENNYDENSKNYKKLSYDKIREEIIETKIDSNLKENLTFNAVEFKFATPDVMFGNQDPTIRQRKSEFKKPIGTKEIFSLQSYRKRRNSKAKSKKKYYKKANVNSNLPREGRVGSESPHLDSSKIPKEQRII